MFTSDCFSLDTPFASIAAFHNQQEYFNAAERTRFVLDVRQFFARCAYLDKDVPLPREYAKRFEEIDLPLLLAERELTKVDKLRMVATMEKVTRCRFERLSMEFRVCQFHVNRASPQGRKLADSWCWMAAKTLGSSNLEGDLQRLTPSAQRALDEVAELLYGTFREGRFILGTRMGPLVDLMRFAVENRIEPLKECLQEIFRGVNDKTQVELVQQVCKSLEIPFTAEMSAQIPFHSLRDVIRGGRRSLSGAQEEFICAFPESMNARPTVSLLSPLDNPEPSPYFDPQNPFPSIARFSDRCSALNTAEQNALFLTIRAFIFSKARQGQTLEIPAEYLQRFTLVDCKFLTDFLPGGPAALENRDLERHRFIAALQAVTKKQFAALGQEDRIVPATMQFRGSEETFSGWLRGQLPDGSHLEGSEFTAVDLERGYAEEESILLEGVHPLLASILKQFQYPPTHLRNLQQLTAATPLAESLVELLRLARKWSMTYLEREIVDVLQTDQSVGVRVCDQIGSALRRREVFETLRDAKIGILEPDLASMEEEDLFHLLRFNMEFLDETNLERIMNASLGEKTENLRVLMKYRRGVANPALAGRIDAYLVERFRRTCCREVSFVRGSQFFVKQVFKAMYEGEHALEGDALTFHLDHAIRGALLMKENGEEAAVVLRAFARDEVQQFFQAMGCPEYPEIIVRAVRSHQEAYGAAFRGFIDAVETYQCTERSYFDLPPIPEFSEVGTALNVLLTQVSARYQNRTLRVREALFGITDSLADPKVLERILRIFNAPTENVDLSESDVQFLINDGKVTLLREILTSKEMRSFCEDNELVPACGQALMVLDTQCKKQTIRGTMEYWMLNGFHYAIEKVDGIGAFLRSYPSFAEFVGRDTPASFSVEEVNRYYSHVLTQVEQNGLVEDSGEGDLKEEAPDPRMYFKRELLKTLFLFCSLHNKAPALEQSALKRFFAAILMSSYMHPALATEAGIALSMPTLFKLSNEQAGGLIEILGDAEIIALFEEHGMEPQRQALLKKLEERVTTQTVVRQSLGNPARERIVREGAVRKSWL